MKSVNPKWSVCYRSGYWRIRDPKGHWHDTASTLEKAYDEALRQALCEWVWQAPANELDACAWLIR